MPSSKQGRRTFLKRSAGALAAVSLSVATTGTAAAESGKQGNCFPQKLDIEIKPGNGDATDPINPGRDGDIPVVVYQTDEFDPTAHDVQYRFDADDEVGCRRGATPAHGGHVEDVDGDGRDDLVLHFPAEETHFARGDQRGVLLWIEEQAAHEGEGKGEPGCACSGLAGSDAVKIVGRKQ